MLNINFLHIYIYIPRCIHLKVFSYKHVPSEFSPQEANRGVWEYISRVCSLSITLTQEPTTSDVLYIVLCIGMYNLYGPSTVLMRPDNLQGILGHLIVLTAVLLRKQAWDGLTVGWHDLNPRKSRQWQNKTNQHVCVHNLLYFSFS